MMGGLSYMTGPVGRPLRAGTSVNDIMGGMFGAIGVLAALRERDRTGRGQEVQSALFENCVFLSAQHMQQHLMTGEPVPPMPSRVSAWSVYDVFTLADDEQLFIGAVSDTQFLILCRVLEAPELAADPALATNAQRVAVRPELLAELGRDPAPPRRRRAGAQARGRRPAVCADRQARAAGRRPAPDRKRRPGADADRRRRHDRRRAAAAHCSAAAAPACAGRCRASASTPTRSSPRCRAGAPRPEHPSTTTEIRRPHDQPDPIAPIAALHALPARSAARAVRRGGRRPAAAARDPAGRAPARASTRSCVPPQPALARSSASRS